MASNKQVSPDEESQQGESLQNPLNAHTPDHYRRPTVALNKLKDTVSQKKLDGKKVTVGDKIQARVANGLEAARSHGVLPDRAVADIANMANSSDAASNPFAVSAAGIEIRMQFRRKLLSLLLLNLTCVLMIISFIQVTPVVREYITTNRYFGFFSFTGFLICLLVLNLVHDKAPWNYLMLVVFTIVFGLFFGNPNGFNSYSNFTIIGTCVGSIFFMLVLSTSRWKSCAQHRPDTSEESDGSGNGILAMNQAAIAGFFITMVPSLIFQLAYFIPAGHGTFVHWLSSQIMSGLAVAYFSYDTIQIETRVMADRYLDGVVLFYSDFLTVVLCGCCIAAFSGG